MQELRSKKTLDKLSILASPKAVAVRDGKRVTVDTAQLVRDDIVVFAAGNQIYADAVVAQDSCYVNEALITGESDEIKKNPGDKLLSGSFVVSGTCRAQLTDVGADSYVSRLTQEAKRAKKPQQSEMMRALQNLVKWIGILVIPLGVVMFIKEFVWLDRAVPIAVTSTVGSIIGMIPDGLYLLTSLALVAGVVRLAQRKTLVHELGCIETLARVDTLCVDKTGTVTENKMIVEDVCPLCGDRFTLDDIRMIMQTTSTPCRRTTTPWRRCGAISPAKRRRTRRQHCRSRRRRNTAACRSTPRRRICSARRTCCSPDGKTPIRSRSMATPPRAAACCCWACMTARSRTRRWTQSCCRRTDFALKQDPRRGAGDLRLLCQSGVA